MDETKKLAASNRYECLLDLDWIGSGRTRVCFKILRGGPRTGPRFDIRTHWMPTGEPPYAPTTKGVTFGPQDMAKVLEAFNGAARWFLEHGDYLPQDEHRPAPAPKKTRARVKLEPVAVTDADILELHRAGLNGREISETFGISTPTVSRRLRRALQGEPPEISRATDEISSAPSVTTSEPDSAGGRDQVEFALEPTE
jgi:hypothetical protein